MYYSYKQKASVEYSEHKDGSYTKACNINSDMIGAITSNIFALRARGRVFLALVLYFLPLPFFFFCACWEDIELYMYPLSQPKDKQAIYRTCLKT